MGIFCSLTDVSTVWSADCTEDLVDQCVRHMFALRATEEKLLNSRQDGPEAGSQRCRGSVLVGLKLRKCPVPQVSRFKGRRVRCGP